jgi:hypothetical protein
MIRPVLFALAFGSLPVIKIADVPVYDIAPVCRAAVTVVAGSYEACLQDEKSAREQLAASWDSFAGPQRDNCVQGENGGGSPSYIELLTCIQMARDASKLPDNKTDGTLR